SFRPSSCRYGRAWPPLARSFSFAWSSRSASGAAASADPVLPPHQHRRLMRGHRGRRAVVALDFDQAGLGDAALAELRGADVERQRVGVAMLLEWPVGAGVFRIEPGA